MGEKDRTLEGHSPGSVKTHGQFQVWAKMHIELLLEKDKKQADEIKELKKDLKEANEKLVLAQKELSKQVTDKLTVYHTRQNDMDKLQTTHGEKIGTVWKVMAALGAGLVSVIGSLLVSYLTKG